MGWDGFSEGTDVIDMAGGAVDSGTLGDVPWMGGLPTIPDWGPVGVGVPNVTQTGMLGGAVMAGAGLAARMSAQALSAIVKLSQKLGGASGSVVGYGRKTWAALSGWAARNPGVSLMSTLVSLGLTVEEAAHFIAWGATSKRKRRTRGISGRDLKTTRRTMRKFHSLQVMFSHACAGVRTRRTRKA
jgi:hypothetical protein